jgi:hypothetical protein
MVDKLPKVVLRPGTPSILALVAWYSIARSNSSYRWLDPVMETLELASANIFRVVSNKRARFRIVL